MSRRSAIDWPPLICGAKVPIWVRLRALLLTVLAWARMDGRRMRATASLPQAVPLSLAAQAAAACRLDATTLAAWREARMLVVQFDAEGRVTHGELKLLGSSRADDACHPGLPTAGAGS